MGLPPQPLRPLDPDFVADLVRRCLAEDVGRGDVTTTAVVTSDATGLAHIESRGSAVVAGLDVAAACFAATGGDSVKWSALVTDGDRVERGDILATIQGTLSSILTAERTALNLLARMCGVATMAATYASAVAGSGTRVVDTRKTMPGLRVVDKYAVRVGGCYNHRSGLDDGVLIKDNHIMAAGGVSAAVERARARIQHGHLLEVEVTTLDELEEAIGAGADAVLLDNMDPQMVASAGARAGGRVVLEASGGIGLDNIAAYTATGVDLISVGALTHGAPHVDLSLEVQAWS
ncbi:MAG TPA: carboxylating nicotinate-nucleotide diphosphorylase [Actinomycetota bacterium]|nr:carboxylating nicotinate-nucleotide diphosphorylase [Actinomycetota bacterium]